MAFQLVSQKTWDDFYSNPPLGMVLPSKPSLASLANYVPMRSTPKSAGYDFRMPFSLTCEPRKRIVVPTGYKWDPQDSMIKAMRGAWPAYAEEEDVLDPEYAAMMDQTHPEREMTYRIYDQVFLGLYPRSSLGFNYGFELLNTTGIIDADYFDNSDNEGHIIVAFKVRKPLQLNAGDKFCQGIIQPYAHVIDEVCANNERTGGMGSTGR